MNRFASAQGSRLSGTAPAFAPERGAAIRRQEHGALQSGRRQRLKAAALAVGRTLLAMAVSAALCLGAFQAWDQALRSPLFAIRKIQVRGAVHAREDDLIVRSGLAAGQNLFRADLASAARGVESSPWVISASVSRRFPPAIEIEVVEHVAAAKVALGPAYLVDVEGRVFKKLADEDGALQLPLIAGLTRADWEDRRAEVQKRILLSLQLADAWRKEGLPPPQLAEIRFDAEGSLSALSRDRAGDEVRTQEIRVGPGPFAAKLHRLSAVRGALGRRGEQASRIDLDNQARPDQVAAQIVPIPDRPAAQARAARRQEE